MPGPSVFIQLIHPKFAAFQIARHFEFDPRESTLTENILKEDFIM